jgi:hypothetical protein
VSATSAHVLEGGTNRIVSEPSPTSEDWLFDETIRPSTDCDE